MKLTGRRAFFWQTTSASFLAFYTPYLVWLVLTQPIHKPLDFYAPSILIPTLIAIALVLVHAWVGLRDVIIDYMPRVWLAWLLPGLLALVLTLSLNLIWLLFKGLSL
ncbi:succinate dehydrogenase, hydrophobic membrane anchor protein [Thiomicrospira sp. R3]|uniref:succinate dehydrogenase, hydrophobic membrane anchor protein n=1 Tax=Thiomicrospira sp. R3 TaxID=3035472 RepID=UPI00259BC003|nr:succinate dehydrogenase, hydrophobic membrane anchor protein [Thiomicrospira sp. R3]WFE68311.1 succinate dehydrogenase, hydrophobic membrane anchor protein [Thiomicrospira sp. R3]